MTTPRTNAIREAVNASGASHAEDICTCLDHAERLEVEVILLINDLDRACAAAGMLPTEPGRHQLLADWVRVARALQDS